MQRFHERQSEGNEPNELHELDLKNLLTVYVAVDC